jgi:hypothetical protein
MKILGELPGPIEFVAMGHVALDLRDGERVLGGAAAYGCLAAARLGRASVMVTAVGEDFDLFEPLQGIEIHYHPSHESTTFRNRYRGAERHQHLLGRARPLAEEDLASLKSRLAEEATILLLSHCSGSRGATDTVRAGRDLRRGSARFLPKLGR